MQIKNLHPMVAAQLKLILKRNDIRIELERAPGTDTYKVFDPMGKELISYMNGWDYGIYVLSALGGTVASIEWRENDNKTTAEQKAVFEIGELISKRMHELKSLQTMSEEDKHTMNLLQEYTTETSKQK